MPRRKFNKSEHYNSGRNSQNIHDNKKCNSLTNSSNSVMITQPVSQQQGLLLTPQNHSNPVQYGCPQSSTRKSFPPLDTKIINSIGKLEKAASNKRKKIIELLEKSPESAKDFLIVTKSSKIINFLPSTQKDGLSTITKASREETSTVQPKGELTPFPKALPSPNKSRTLSPILDVNLTTLNSFRSTPINTSIPHLESTLPLLSPDTSDIEGALKDMSPLQMQDLEEDLEILYSRLKSNSKCISQDLTTEEEDPNSFHALAERIREALSISNPDINKALSLLDTLQANYLVAEITTVTPVPVKQRSQQINKSFFNMNQSPSSSNHQATTGIHILPPPNSSNYTDNTPPEPIPNPTILLYPTTNSTSNLSEILNEALSPRDFNPTNIKPLRGNGLAISFQTSSQIKQFQSKLEENNNLKSSFSTKLPTKRSPSFIIYNVPNPTKEAVIQEALKTQLNLTNPLNLRFKFKVSSTKTTNWVFEATTPTLNIIQQVQKIRIGWSMLKISEFFHFKKCNFCQAFGHTTKDCHRQIPSCSKCADHHLISDCQSQTFCCINCLESNIFTGSEYSTFHTAKDRSCPFFQDAINKYRATRDYT
ncbi:hypothetical protein AVEN_264258-1 [Araneus ventricosus]|uniref:Pre-C2HC domain-containing protein n=1 Tax=Araneus ventricosus TaxID=182803 RepID=A0A4Y2VZ49_ARAVE|nr:hypothetical protein AVEN_264258-1 [Araneus ventricosus]